MDLKNLGKNQELILTPKAKKAKKKLKKILEAALFKEEPIEDQEDKKAKIQANKRNLNAQRIARATKIKQESSISNPSINNDTTETEHNSEFNMKAFCFL